MTVKLRLKQMRCAKDMTQAELGHMSHVATSAISLFENGYRLPSFHDFINLCMALDCYADDLIDWGKR